VFGRFANGSLIASKPVFDEEGELRSGFQRIPLAFLSLSSDDGAVRDTVLTVPGPERVVHTTADASGGLATVEISAPAFVKATAFTAHESEIFVATQDAPQIDVYAATGELRRIVRTGKPMPAVTEQHLDAWIERMARNAPPEVRERMLARRDHPDAGDVVPPFATIEVDDAGNLWIADYDDRINPAGAWSVHDPDGRLLARIRVPDGLRLLHIGSDFVLGVLRDDLDVEHVRLYRLSK
jgi:hypothetical protein